MPVLDDITQRVGILAYGSLIDDPGDELKGAISIILKEGVTTPFKVEFARSSKTRACAPTLIPVESGGKQVPAQIFVLRRDISEKQAKDILWRRETGNIGKSRGYSMPDKLGANDVIVERLEKFYDVGVVLYTKIAQNIVPLTEKKIADLALKSARALRDGRDGISYLIVAKSNGVETLLSSKYEEEIKRQAGVKDLKEALNKMQSSTVGDQAGGTKPDTPDPSVHGARDAAGSEQTRPAGPARESPEAPNEQQSQGKPSDKEIADLPRDYQKAFLLVLSDITSKDDKDEGEASGSITGSGKVASGSRTGSGGSLARRLFGGTPSATESGTGSGGFLGTGSGGFLGTGSGGFLGSRGRTDIIARLLTLPRKLDESGSSEPLYRQAYFAARLLRSYSSASDAVALVIDDIDFSTSRNSPIYTVMRGLIYSVIGLCLVVIVVLGLWAELSSHVTWDQVEHSPYSNFIVAMGFGMLGAVVSVLLRLSEFENAARRSRQFLQMTGIMLPIVGAIFAGVTCALFKINLINFTGQQNLLDNTYFFIVVGFLSGFSERFTRGLLGTAERLVTRTEEKSVSKEGTTQTTVTQSAETVKQQPRAA
jgi:hypothetical protein